MISHVRKEANLNVQIRQMNTEAALGRTSVLYPNTSVPIILQ